uniref:Uncharacterized protein n=1 Tax=Arundo donax TaxID=35708 RepID=A0A0A9ANE5_ARUDO
MKLGILLHWESHQLIGSLRDQSCLIRTEFVTLPCHY